MSEAAFARLSLLDAHPPADAFRPWRTRPSSAATSVAEPPPEPDRFAMGYAEGERVAAAAFADERVGLQKLLAEAHALQPEPSEELAVLIATTVEQLVTEIIGRMPIERKWLEERTGRAVSCIAEADAARTLWMHPDDIELLADADLSLDLCPDPKLERGALRIDCSHGWIEDGRSQHLDALRTMLGSEAES